MIIFASSCVVNYLSFGLKLSVKPCRLSLMQLSVVCEIVSLYWGQIKEWLVYQLVFILFV